MDTKQLFHETQNLTQICLTQRQLAALAIYTEELSDWNSRFNLTAIRDAPGVRVRHVLDSLTCWKAMRGSSVKRVIDVGTGAGFPGLPLKIVFPEMHLTLVESVGKKARFCQHIVDCLGLKGVAVMQTRAEDIGRDLAHREQYDWAIARAVARLPILSEYLLPLVRVNGAMLAQKGETGPAEAHVASHAIAVLGGRLRQLVPVTLPGVVEERFLVVVDKVASTPNAYPRRVGVPSKQPL